MLERSALRFVFTRRGIVPEACSSWFLPRLVGIGRALAREIVERTAPVAVARARQMMRRMLGADHPMEAHKVDSRGIFQLGGSPGVAEGIAALREKRASRFGMRVPRDVPPSTPGGRNASSSSDGPVAVGAPLTQRNNEKDLQYITCEIE